MTSIHDTTVGAGVDLADQIAATGHGHVHVAPGDMTLYRIAAWVDDDRLFVALVGHGCDQLPMLGHGMYPQHDGYVGAKFGPARAAGVPAAIDQIETALCDFNSLTRGRYYVGHDTDLMLERALAAPPSVRDRLLTAREALPASYRGEVGGWTGVDTERKRVYRDTGQIVLRQPFSGPESNEPPSP